MGRRRRHVLSCSSRKSILSFSSFHKPYWLNCFSTSCKTLFKTHKICSTLSVVKSSCWSTLVLSNRRSHFPSTKGHHGILMPVHTLYPGVTLSFSWYLQTLQSSLPEYQTQSAKLTDTLHGMKISHSHQNLSSHDLSDLKISWIAVLSFTNFQDMARCFHHNSKLPQTWTWRRSRSSSADPHDLWICGVWGNRPFQRWMMRLRYEYCLPTWKAFFMSVRWKRTSGTTS